MTKREHEMMTVEGGGNNDAEEINTNDDDHDDEEEATPTNKNGNKKLITPPVKTKQKKKPRGSIKFEKKLLAIPHPQLCTVLATFLGNDIELQQRFVASLPAVDVTSLTIKLEQSARAIQKALPNSRVSYLIMSHIYIYMITTNTNTLLFLLKLKVRIIQ